MVDGDFDNLKDGDGDAGDIDSDLVASGLIMDWDRKLDDAKSPQRGFPWLGMVGVFVLGLSMLIALNIGSFGVFSSGLIVSLIFFGLQAILSKLNDVLDEMKKS